MRLNQPKVVVKTASYMNGIATKPLFIRVFFRPNPVVTNFYMYPQPTLVRGLLWVR
jgi:hypothetical protein